MACLELGQWGIIFLCLCSLWLLLVQWGGASLLLVNGRQHLLPAVRAAAAAVANRFGGAELHGSCLASLQHGEVGTLLMTI
jgi:hypothetical protein